MGVKVKLGKDKKPKDEKKELADMLGELPVTADDSLGTFTESTSEDEQFAESDVKTKRGKVSEKFGEYKKELYEGMKKHPDQYLVKTSKGEMTIEEAYRQGWDPKTDKFGEERPAPDRDKMMEGLSDQDRESIGKLTDPGQHMPPDSQREKYGMDPMMGGGMPPEGMPPEEGGGLPLGAGATGMPAEGEPAAGENPLGGILGGGGM